MKKASVQEILSITERQLIVTRNYWRSMEQGAWDRMDHYTLNTDTPYYRGRVAQSESDLKELQTAMKKLGLVIDEG